MFGKFKTIHFVGIGGTGMSGIAEILHNLNFKITGSDLKESDYTKRLKKLGIQIKYGHKPEHVENADVMVVSSAIKRDNPEWVAADEKHIPVIPRGEMLAELMRMKHGIAVSGTHGKTSTTSMAASVFHEAEIDPTVIIGGIYSTLGSNAELGQSKYLLAEADESDGSFLGLNPVYSIITNIDEDHMDYYETLENLKESFVSFANKVPFYGAVIACLEDENVKTIIPDLKKRVITYGFSPHCNVRATDIVLEKGKSLYTLNADGRELGQCEIHVPGTHNILNSLSVVALCLELDIDIHTIINGLKKFKGTKRRAETIGFVNDIRCISDYAHHPVEISTTLDAISSFYKPERMICVFQPHRYTRTQALFERFCGCFHASDICLVLPIYSAGEKEIEGIHSEALVEGIKKAGHRQVRFIKDFKCVGDFVSQECSADDLLVCLGAGSIDINLRQFVEKGGSQGS